MRGRPYLTLVLTALSVAIVAWTRLPLVWDGSYYLFTALNEQMPVAFNHRSVASILTTPVVLASRGTADPTALALVFDLSYASVPFIALLVAWLVVRRSRPELFVWPALSIGLALLPARALAVSEALIAVQLAWPPLLAALTWPTRGTLALALGCAIVVAVSHPIGFALLIGIAAVGWTERRGRARAIWLALFVALAVVNALTVLARLTEYEVQSARPIALAYEIATSALGPQLAGLLLAAAAAWLVLSTSRPGGPPTGRAAIASGLAVVPFALWAAQPDIWRDVLGYRAWALPATVPLYLLAWLDARRPPSAGAVAERMRVSEVAAAVALVVVIVQGAVWTGMVARVTSALAGRSGCVVATAIEGYSGSPLDNWTIVPLSVVVQGREVRAFIATADVCASAAWPRELPMLGSTPERPKWFRADQRAPSLRAR